MRNIQLSSYCSFGLLSKQENHISLNLKDIKRQNTRRRFQKTGWLQKHIPLFIKGNLMFLLFFFLEQRHLCWCSKPNLCWLGLPAQATRGKTCSCSHDGRANEWSLFIQFGSENNKRCIARVRGQIKLTLETTEQLHRVSIVSIRFSIFEYKIERFRELLPRSIWTFCELTRNL